MKNRLVFIAAALESVELIKSYIEGYSLADFLKDRKTQDAVIRNLEIIGQSLKDFGIDELSSINPNVSWRAIAGMRNILAHEYLGVDVVMVWETVSRNLNELESALETLMKSN